MSGDLREKRDQNRERILDMMVSGEMDETGAVTRQLYPCMSGNGRRIYVVNNTDDEHLRLDLPDGDALYLCRSQVRGLMHQLTDWLTWST